MREIKLQEIKDKFDVCLGFFGSPPVIKNDKGYQIRIKTFAKYNYRLGTTRISWDYFMTDNKGVIYRSPRGYAKEYNKKVRIVDIEKEYEIYKELRTDNQIMHSD